MSAPEWGFQLLDSPPWGLGDVGRWYVVRGTDILTDEHGAVPLGLRPPVDEHSEPIFLGTYDGRAAWAVGAPEHLRLPAGTAWTSLRSLMAGVDEWRLAARAVGMVTWWRTSQYCGCCGAATEPMTGVHAKVCARCGAHIFPRLSPAIIVLIERGHQALLARNRKWPDGRYSAVAGFVEPGETLEAAVRREVAEEVGIELGSITYVASQPWPFPDSLMCGFRAAWASGEIVVDGDEIADARWFDPDDLPNLPPPMTIARRLIEDWRQDGRRERASSGP